MDEGDGFEVTFRVGIPTDECWARLTGADAPAAGDRIWLPGFDSQTVVGAVDEGRRLEAVKDEEPCAGTDIVITLTADDGGTVVHVVQSGFGGWLADHLDLLAVGWRHLTSDLQTFLATGVHAGRHLLAWGDLGADATPADGGMRLSDLRAGGLAAGLGLLDGDLLVTLGGAPVSSTDDLVTILRVLPDGSDPAATWIRDGRLLSRG